MQKYVVIARPLIRGGLHMSKSDRTEAIGWLSCASCGKIVVCKQGELVRYVLGAPWPQCCNKGMVLSYTPPSAPEKSSPKPDR